MAKKAKPRRKAKEEPVVRPIVSEDKQGVDPNPPQKHPCSVPCGSRVAFCAPPGHGKTSHAKHVAIYSRPFAAVYVIHGAGEFTQEWSKTVHQKIDFKQATPEF